MVGEIIPESRATSVGIRTILAKAEREGTLREKIRFLCRCSLLVVGEIGYLPVTPAAAICSSNWSTPAMKRAP